jgi:hypothetical protein
MKKKVRQQRPLLEGLFEVQRLLTTRKRAMILTGRICTYCCTKYRK